jgi:hypothetical protein
MFSISQLSTLLCETKRQLPILNLEAKEPELQCLPTGRGTTVVTSDHDGVAIATGDATAVVAAAGLNLEAKEPESQC